MATVNFDPIARGDSDDLDGTVTTAAGVAVNITGFSIWFTLKWSKGDADVDAVLQKTTADGITITSGADGEFTVTIDAGDLDAVDKDASLYYDIQIKDGTGKVYTRQEGLYRVTRDVTRSIT